MLVQAEEQDALQLAEIEAEAFPVDEAADKAGINFRIKNAKQFFLKYIIDDVLIGYVNGTLTLEPEITHDCMAEHKVEGQNLIIHSVTIVNTHRKKGHGRAMLNAYLNRIREESNVRRVLLLAKKHLCHFYESVGFEVLRVSPIVHGKETWYELGIDI